MYKIRETQMFVLELFYYTKKKDQHLLNFSKAHTLFDGTGHKVVELLTFRDTPWYTQLQRTG